MNEDRSILKREFPPFVVETPLLNFVPPRLLIFVLPFSFFLVTSAILIYVLMAAPTEVSSSTYAASVTPASTVQAGSVAMQPTGTLGAIIATAVNDPVQEATLAALIQSEIAAAVQGTLIALTPTATLLPTRAPVEETFTEQNPRLGLDDAPITLVEFSDYLCTYCGRFHAETLEPLLEHYGDLVRFVYREYPIIGQNVTAFIGSSAQCANLQGKYWEFSNLVWGNQLGESRQEFTEDLLASYASDIGLDMIVYNRCLADGAGFDLVVADFNAGRAYNISGTPTFFINGERVVGALPINYFMDVIDLQLRELGIQPPARS